jgi:hypothetical protein
MKYLIATLLMLITLNGCQWRPVYGAHPESQALAASLSQIQIIVPESQTGLALEEALRRRLHTGYHGTKPTYKLQITLTEKDQVLTGAPSLTNAQVSAHYIFFEQHHAEPLFEEHYNYVSHLIDDRNPLAIMLSGETLHAQIAAEMAESIAGHIERHFLKEAAEKRNVATQQH